MAEKNKDAAEAAPAESAVVDTVAPVAPEAATTAPRRRRLPVLATVGIAVGGVVLAGALFGGGVLVGTALPGGPGGGPNGGPGMSQDLGDRGPGQGEDMPGLPGEKDEQSGQSDQP